MKPSDLKDPKLEAVSQSLYDTQYQSNPYHYPPRMRQSLLKESPEIRFFNNPAGRPLAMTNFQSAGSLPWPKRFDARCLSFYMEHDPGPDVLKALELKFTVGEKDYFCAAVSAMESCDCRDYRLGWKADLAVGVGKDSEGTGVYIPPLQYFGVVLHTSGRYLGENELRVVLDGILLREVQ